MMNWKSAGWQINLLVVVICFGPALAYLIWKLG